jgi:hypothetical protein
MHLTDEEHISELESIRQQLQGDIVDVCHSAKKIILAYLGYHERNLEPEINHINRMAAIYALKGDNRLRPNEWWNCIGLRKDISRMSMQEKMEWAYNQGLNA